MDNLSASYHTEATTPYLYNGQASGTQTLVIKLPEPWVLIWGPAMQADLHEHTSGQNVLKFKQFLTSAAHWCFNHQSISMKQHDTVIIHLYGHTCGDVAIPS